MLLLRVAGKGTHMIHRTQMYYFCSSVSVIISELKVLHKKHTCHFQGFALRGEVWGSAQLITFIPPCFVLNYYKKRYYFLNDNKIPHTFLKEGGRLIYANMKRNL